jgi:hypothetical protein
MPRFLVPVEGLTLDASLQVGPVTIHNAETVANRLAAHIDHPSLAESPSVAETTAQLKRWSAAEVEAPDIDGAFRIVRDVVDLLRVFMESRAMFQTAKFGLPGDVRALHFHYVDLDKPNSLGYRNPGDIVGSGFSPESRQALASSRLAELANLAASPNPPPGPARAMLAVRLLSRAVLEENPALKLLSTVIAIETLLGGGKTYQLARRAAYLTCGAPEGDLCGRQRPTCPFLTLDPSDEPSRRQIQRLEDAACLDIRERCSEWLDFVNRYKDRSGIAHGDPNFNVSVEDADKDLFWALHYLVPTALEWLLDHPADPAGALESAIYALPTTSGPPPQT